MNDAVELPEVYWRDAVVGTRYHVEIGDCCVGAEFTAALVSIVWSGGERDDKYPASDGWLIDRAEFDNGVIIDSAGSISLAGPA